MAAAISTNPSLTSESKSARKKKAKATVATPDAERSNSAAGVNGDGNQGSSDGGFENAYVKELQKQMRNVTKKLNATQRVDKIIEENSDKSLDQLVAAKLINQDQKAQALKKPALQAQLSSLEEQLAHYKKFDGEYQEAMAKERELLKSSQAKELEAMRDAERKATKVEMEKEFRLRMLTFGRFLKAAAARRQDETVEPDEEGKAFEGVLSNVYTGDVSAVEAIEKLITGSEEKVRDFTGELDVTYARIKALSIEEAPVVDEDPFSGAETFIEPKTTSGAHDPEGSDPTITHAGLTEIDTQTAIPNGTSNPDTPLTAPPTGSITADGNAAAEEQWDTKVPGEAGMDDSFEIIPRDPQEVDIKEVNAPAAVTSTQSWADEAQDAAQGPTSNGTTDGFHEVQHRGRGRGGPRGGSFGEGRGRGGPRGRGFRGGPRGGGERGRGRGGPRGGRGD